MNRREFGRLVALTGSEALVRSSVLEGLTSAPLQAPPADTPESYWQDVRARFLVPRDVAFLNAANLCPASLPAIEAISRNVREYEPDPSPEFRSALMARGREEVRKALAQSLRVTPEEVVITRNTTEGNNVVSSGLDLRSGDEVVVWEDNHPSNLNAWRVKAQRFGFSVVAVPVPPSHPGADGYVELFTKAFTPRTRLVAITHVSSNSGDVLPAADICAAARSRGILSLVDGAQAFGVIDLDLSRIKPDFYTGSLSKWPCGPKEKGLLFVNKDVHDRIHPSVIGLYQGAIGISRTLEAHGQRDDASVAAVVEALQFQQSIGRDRIEKRSRELAQALMSGLRKIPGVKMWTDAAPAHSAAIVIFQPAALDVRKLGAALTRDKIICTPRTGSHNPGLRMAPHFFNTMDEIDRAAAAIRKYAASGV